jgi:hypothetical protein
LELSATGINSSLIAWLMDFLTNHKQKVHLFELVGQPIYSDEAIVMSGVLQGTVLGPTLLLIYINDISNHVDNNMHLFADDAKLSGIANPHKIQHNLDRLQNWTQDWLLQFNTSK